MNVSVFGLGYVGCVSAACLARAGHQVIGVDVNDLKVKLILEGKSPIVEPGIGELLEQTVREGQLRATTDAKQAVLESDVSLVCVGTPAQTNGSLDLTFIKRVCKEIGRAMEQKGRYHVVAMRSTMLPGTVQDTVKPALEVFSGRRAGKDFGVAVNPEFLREGSSIHDFHSPPFTLIGSEDQEAVEVLSKLYEFVDARTLIVGTREAEMIKYACNAFHAAKVVFANEIGNVCKELGVDSRRVMNVLVQDTKLNLSPRYLTPGFAFGGSCLPKDIRALVHKAKMVDVDLPMLSSLLPSNRHQVERAADIVLALGVKKIGMLGMSFKAGTDDLRESPLVSLIEILIGKGIQLAIYDHEVELARIQGANKAYIEAEIPHIASLMRATIEDVLAWSPVVIVGKKDDEYRLALEKAGGDRRTLDLVDLSDEPGDQRYQGINW